MNEITEFKCESCGRVTTKKAQAVNCCLPESDRKRECLHGWFWWSKEAADSCCAAKDEQR
jgi:hypothetical protein